MRDLVEALSKMVSVTVVAPAPSDEVGTIGNIQHRLFRFDRLPVSSLKPSRLTNWLPIIQLLAIGRRQAMNALSLSDYQHILALWTLPGGLWARSARKNGVPYSVWALGSDIWDLNKLPYGTAINRWIIRSAYKVYADGVRLSEEVSNLSGRQCAFLPTARSLSLGAPKGPKGAPPFRMAFLGRWHVNKGIDILLASLEQFDEADWRRIAEIRIYGGGPLDSMVVSKVAGLQASGRPVVIGGYLEKEAARKLLKWADWVFIPSRIESIPVVFSDAIQAGCGVIAMPVGDLPSLISRYQVGVFASGLSTEAYYQAIKAAIDGDVAISRLGYERARADFDLQKIAERLATDLKLVKPQDV